MDKLAVSERRACRVLGEHRSTQRKFPQGRADEDALTRTIIAMACKYGRYGSRRIHWLLEQQGWHVGLRRVKRIWRREGLKVPTKQPKRGRLWLNDESCFRLRQVHKNHIWSYDFVQDRTHDGKALRMLTVIDVHSRASLAIHVRRKLNSQDVLHVLGKLFARHGPPEHIHCDSGPEFVTKAVREWLARLQIKTLFITPGHPGRKAKMASSGTSA